MNTSRFILQYSRSRIAFAASTVSFPPDGIASLALIARFNNATSSWSASTSTVQRPAEPAVSISTVSPSARCMKSTAPTINLLMSRGLGLSDARRENAKSRCVKDDAR